MNRYGLQKLERSCQLSQLLVAKRAVGLHLVPDAGVDPGGVVFAVEVDFKLSKIN